MYRDAVLYYFTFISGKFVIVLPDDYDIRATMDGKNMNKAKCGNKGFTLVELIVVVAIIGVLAGISAVSYSSYIDKAKLTLSIGVLSTLKKSLEAYSIEYQNYPTTIDFNNFTDQDGNAVVDASLIQQLKSNVFSFDSYVFTAPSYKLVAKGADSKHTVITVTPEGISNQGAL